MIIFVLLCVSGSALCFLAIDHCCIVVQTGSAVDLLYHRLSRTLPSDRSRKIYIEWHEVLATLPKLHAQTCSQVFF